MNAYMTNGTIDFLSKIAQKHSQITFHLMVGESSTLAYYEDLKKSIFAAGRNYEILLKSGNIEEKGYVVMNNIPVSEEGKPVFETSFNKRQQAVEAMNGFQAFRLLKPLTGNTYVVLTQWASEKDYEAWKSSEAFAKAHLATDTKQPAYFMERPFVHTYAMYDPNAEDADL